MSRKISNTRLDASIYASNRAGTSIRLPVVLGARVADRNHTDVERDRMRAFVAKASNLSAR